MFLILLSVLTFWMLKRGQSFYFPVRWIFSIFSLQIEINVIDLNDCVPQFSEEFYEVSIKEDAEVGVVVLTVVATDGDVDGELFYIFYNQSLSFRKLMQLCRRIFELHQSFLHAIQRHLSKNPIRNKNYHFISNLLKCLLYPNFLGNDHLIEFHLIFSVDQKFY